jgi:dipeptidase
VLETAGSYWVAERVQSVRSISNGLTIGGEWDLASQGVVEHALEKGWCKSRDEFHFARCYSDRLYTRLDGCRPRQRRSTELVQARRGRVDVLTMMDALRDHGPEAIDDPTWNPGKGLTMNSLCVHASMGPLRPSQTTGSMVAHLAADLQTFWLTGTAAPCTSIFKPAYLGGSGLPAMGPEPTGVYDLDSLWWSHERLHRRVIRDYGTRLPLYREQREILEASFVVEAEELRTKLRTVSTAERASQLTAFTRSCFDRAGDATGRWTKAVSAAPVRKRPPILFSLAWDILNRQAKFER